MIGSGSASARLVTAACLAAIGTAVLLRRRHRSPGQRAVAAAVTGALLLAPALLLAVVLAGGGGRLAALVGRDATLSGRTRLWSAVLDDARQRPWLGHGYATYWPRAQAAGEGRAPGPRRPPHRHPHNGFLALFDELGTVGLTCFLIPFAALARRALRWSITPRAPLWPGAYLLFLALANLTETGLLGHQIFWALYVAVALELNGDPDPRQGRRAPRHRR